MFLHSHRVWLSIALAALLATPLWTSNAAGATGDSNIPGVPLPGPVVTGLLGGSVYDHVYSLDVPPGRVILLSLTGDRGVDFGLYLFDRRATTVYSTIGQVAASALPGSNQTIRYPTITGGRFYIDLNGASNVQAPFRLVVSIGADTMPPRASVSLDGGATATRNPDVRVTLGASDDLSGVKDMQFSADGQTWAAWQAYASSLSWSFQSGDGTKRLWARVRDAAGNLSGVTSASIALDTVPPLVLARSPEPGGNTVGLRAPFTVTFSEPMDVVSWLDSGLLLQDTAGTVIHGTYSWEGDRNSGTFVPAVPLVPGGVYVATVGTVTDIAGNPVPSLGGWVIRALVGHDIAISATPSVTTTPGQTTISGRTDIGIGGPLVLEESTAGGPWGAVASLQQDAAGAFAVPIPVIRNTSFRVHFVGSEIEAETYSPVVRVLVRRSVRLAVRAAAIPDTVRAGQPVTVVAQLDPPAPEAAVTLAITRYDTKTARWQPVSTVKRSTVRGTATFSWRPAIRGTYRLRASTETSARWANGVAMISKTVS